MLRILLVGAIGLGACGPSNAGPGKDGGPGGGADAGNGVVSIDITPADQVLNLPVGTTQGITYLATATFSDGTKRDVTGTWMLADPSIGTMDPVAGSFTANGIVAGVTEVQFIMTDTGATGSTTVTVNLATTVGTDPGFTAAGAPVTDATAQANLVYPLDQVVFPQNVTAPLAQWVIGDGSGWGGTSDWYRLTYAKPNITIVQYVQAYAGFTFSAALPDDVFSRLAESDPTVQGTLVVDRLDVGANRVVAGAPIRMSFANGSVSGTVYYWAMDEARLHRINPGNIQNDPLFPPNIVGTAATDPGYQYGNCIACHQISRDGRYLAANGDQAYVFDLQSADPTQASMPVATRAGYRWYFSTISPDDKRIFATMPDTSFGYTDLSVNPLTPLGTVPTTGVAHPSWSPDGSTVAFISNVTGWNSNASFTGGDLTTVNVDTSTDTFSNLQVIHQGASLETTDPAGGDADCFPSWTPDNKYLMFGHTSNTRGTGSRVDQSMFIIPPSPGATPVRLATASDSAGHAQSHYPNVSPFTSGGYYWIVFYSTRDYGNALAGTAGTARPQLWVSAIWTNFDGTHDPSMVPYWLPGQDTQHQNADAVWAASACRDEGASCATTSDCCSGACEPDGSGAYVCVPATTCRQEGESCGMDSDCCGDGTLTCDPTIHICQLKIG